MRYVLLILVMLLSGCLSSKNTPQEQETIPTGSVVDETSQATFETPEMENSDPIETSLPSVVSSPTPIDIELVANSYEIPPPNGAQARIGRGGIIDVDVSPDGSSLAVITRIGLYIYDLGTMKPIYLDLFEVGFLSPEPISFAQVKWSPDSRFVLGWTTERAQLWDVRRSVRLFSWELKAEEFQFSPDSTQIAVLNAVEGKQEKAVAIIGTTSGEVTSLPEVSGLSVDWSPNGKLLATSGSPTSLIETSSWQVVTEIDASTLDVQFSPDGTLLSGIFSDFTARFWNVPIGQEQLTLQPVLFNTERAPYTVPLQTLGWSPDGSLFAVALQDGAYSGIHIAVWDAHTGQFIHEVENVQTNFEASGIISPDFRRLAFISNTEYATLHEMSTGAEIGRLFGNWTIDTEWMPDSRHLVVVTQDSLVNVWDVETGALVSSIDEHLTSWRCWGPDGWIGTHNTSLISWGDCTRSVIWDVEAKQPVFVSSNLGKSRDRCYRTFECWPGGIQRIHQVAPSPNDYLYDYTTQRVVLAYKDRAEVWQIKGSAGDQLLVSNGTPISFEWPWANQFVAIGFTDRMEIWDVESASMIMTHAGRAEEFSWSDNSRQLAVAFTDHIELWDVTERTLIAEISTSSTNNLTFPIDLWGWAHDGMMLMVSTKETAIAVDNVQGTAMLEMNYVNQIPAPFRWQNNGRIFKLANSYVTDVSTGERIYAVREGDDGYVGAILVNPYLLAVAGWDGTITLWEIDELLDE